MKPSSWHTQLTFGSEYAEPSLLALCLTDLTLQPEHLSANRPIILDETYESPETAALHEEGYEGALVTRAGSPSSLLSMSAYGKQALPQLHGPSRPHDGPDPPFLLTVPGFDTGRTFTDSSFPYLPGNYGSQTPVPSSAAPSFQNMPMAYAGDQTRASFDDQAGPYLTVGSTPTPEVTSYSPSRGAPGTKIFVYITTLYELITSDSPAFFLMFGQRKCPASIAKASPQGGGVCQYQITADAPQFTSTSWSSVQVPLFMFMETGDGDVIAKVDVGHFTYEDGELPADGNANQDVSRKRKLSTESAELLRSPVKRIPVQQLRAKEEYNPFPYAPSDGGASYSPYMQQTAYANQLSQYSRSTSGYASQPSRHLAFSYPSSTASSSPTVKAHSPQSSTWNPSYSNLGSSMRGPGDASSGSHRASVSSLPPPGLTANPPLIRTSILQQPPSPATAPHGAHAGQQFNAYALYPHKAKLELHGDLDAMARNWTEDEWECKRRLVQFKRSQSGSTITTHFQPVTAEDRPPTSICISCIYWEERSECFVTSVDTIYLLEQLVAARFTVEEKNRIRRNLEGFRPLTVSKGKAESEEFFKVIMAFPNPKPRNIEKDVKVFHWKDLASALKKIISKYVSCAPLLHLSLPPLPSSLWKMNGWS